MNGKPSFLVEVRGRVVHIGTIAYSVYDGNDEELYYWDGTNTTQLTDNNTRDYSPSLYNGKIALTNDDSNAPGWGHSIYYWDGTNIEHIAESGVQASLYDGTIAWNAQGNSGILFWDGVSTTRISYQGGNPSLYDGTIAWTGYGREDIYFWDGGSLEGGGGAASIPDAPIMLLLGTSLVGLVGFSRKKLKKS